MLWAQTQLWWWWWWWWCGPQLAAKSKQSWHKFIIGNDEVDVLDQQIKDYLLQAVAWYHLFTL